MNATEQKMLELLKRGRDEFGVVAIKAEFEAEGTRPDELLRLLELTRKAGLDVALKIGGCEAVSDLLACRLYGVDHVIAPMVETPYALTKFIDAKNKVFSEEERRSVQFLFNLETETTLRGLSEMAEAASGGVDGGGVDGIVFGRVDFTLSRGMPRGAINDPAISEAVLATARVCADKDFKLVVGGSVAVEAIEALRLFRKVRLDRFETRKVIFDGAAVESDRIEAGILNAVEFELNWLRNKRDYYRAMATEEDTRIAMLETRVR